MASSIRRSTGHAEGTESPPSTTSVDSHDKVSVLIVADVRLYREGLRANLASRAGLAIVGAVGSGKAALIVVASAQPDVVVLDMATRDSFGIVHAITSAVPTAKIIAFAVEEEHAILACAEAGVAAWMPCEGSIDDLVSTIESVVRDELVCSPKVAATLFRRLASLARGVSQPAPSVVLTGRERQIVALIDDGLSNKEIAQRLHVEVATVKNHVHNILEKLHVHRRAEAAAHLRAPAPGRLTRSMLSGS